MAGDVAYVQLSGATLALYAGMEAQELQMLVRAALQTGGAACCGFQVAPEASKSRKKRIPRLVPLSVACKAPELLTGRVSALMAPSNDSGRALGPEDADKRLQRLLQALETELQLSAFETAVLRDVCDQQRDQVLAVMGGRTSVDQKKDFLLQLLRPEDATANTRPEKKDRKEDTRTTKKDRQEDTLQAELVAKKVVAIGRRVFSPQVQTQVLALADTTRHKWSLGEEGSNADEGRFADTMQLLNMLEKLLDRHVLPEDHGAHLLELVLGGNRVLLSALQSYKNDGGSLTDLETTAKRLAALGCNPPKPIASKKSKGRLTRTNGSPAKKRMRNAAAAVPSAVSVVRSLHAQHMLTSLELDIIQALVAQDDSQVLQLLRDFEQSDHRDVSALRDALVSIVEEITMELGDEEKAAAAFARGLDDAVREENQWEDSDEEDGNPFGWQRHLSFLLGQWQAQHHLTPTDANTLRRMVAQQHNLLESAYEVFAGDGDGTELLDTLQRVAKLQRQIEQSQAGQNVLNGAPASGLSLEDVVRQMQRRGVVQAGNAAGLLVLFHGGNEALQAANEAFQADGDVHELEETLLLVVKHARFGTDDEPIDEGQAVSRLLAEYGRSGRLELWQIQLLMCLLKAHDPRLLAAVDVYNEDKNAEELIETLEILVELAAWERHRRAIVHDWIAPLARGGNLPRGGAERLLQLVKVRDDRVVAALVVYLSDGNKEEFVDTLTRIACLEAMKLKNVMADAKRNESEEGHLVLALLEELEDKGVMTADEREHVEELVCSGDARMLAAMDVLAATHDAEDFADTARRILAKLKQKEIVDESVEAEVSTEAAPSTAMATGGEDEAAKGVEADSQFPEKSGEDASPVAEPQETSQEVASEESEQVDEQEQKEEQEQEKDEEIVTDQVEEDSTEEVEKVTEEVVEDAKDEGENEGKANVEEIELAQ
ncbi:hypothetical protein PRIC2_004929 [Phytophthora ramorum]